MIISRTSTMLALLFLSIPAFVIPVTASADNRDWRIAYERLLKTYATYKHYGDLSIGEIEKTLLPERVNTVQAIVRAAHISVGNGKRLVDLISAIHGIWGVRPGQTEGRYQFRISVIWSSDFSDRIWKTSNFFWSRGAHVLMPVEYGGDDDPAYTCFVLNKKARTWRQIAFDAPRMQVSQLKSDKSVGEIDLDYHPIRCHTSPSNSDSAAQENQHDHLKILNDRLKPEPGLDFPCINKTGHCKDSYSKPYCIQP